MANGTGRPAASVLLVGFQDQDNLGLRYLVSAARAAGHRADIMTFESDPRALVQRALAERPDVIGFSLIFQYMTDAFAAVIAAVREAGIGAHITMGGHYPSFAYGTVFASTPGLDSIVRYDGEATLVELLDCIASGSEWRALKGIATHTDDGAVMSNPLRATVDDLDTLPMPERSDIRYEMSPLPTASILASRGCPWDCSFCSIRPFYEDQGGKLRRLRRPEAVVDEMEALYRERGVPIFLFQDDDFLATGSRARRWATAISQQLKERGLAEEIRFKISCRSDEVREDIIAELISGGLTHVYMGVESGDTTSLATMNKMLEPERHLEAGRILKSLNVSFDFGFMLMEPYSTFETIRNNIAFLEEFVGDGYAVATFCRMLPYAGTPIRTRLAAEGRLKGTETQPDYDFLDPRLDRYYAWMIETFHLRNFSNEGLSYILRILGFQSRLTLDGKERVGADDREWLKYLTAQSNMFACHILRRGADVLEEVGPDRIPDSEDSLRQLTTMSRREEERLMADARSIASRLPQERRRADAGFSKSWTHAEGDWETRGIGAA